MLQATFMTPGRGAGGDEHGKTERRWPIGLLIAFAVMILVNGLFVWVALNGRDPVAESYTTEPR